MLRITSELLPKIRRITAYGVNVTYVGLCSLVQTFAWMLLSYTSFMGHNFTPDV